MSNVPEIDRGTSESSRCRETKLPKVIIVALVAAFLFAASLPLLQSPSSEDPPASVPAGIYYTSHANISIDGNAGFLGPNASTGISWGSGTASDPYIIELWQIDASSSDGIQIQNSDVHFIVRDCNISGGSYDGISLYNCVNGSLERNNCSNNDDGIYLYYSDSNTLSNNTCSSNAARGIYVYYSDSNTLSNNNCSNNNRGIRLYSSNSNNLSYNNCSSNDYGIYVYSSNSNTLSNNTCSSNTNDGIRMWLSSNSNILSNNNCSSNDRDGISVYASSSNSLSWNQLCDNLGYGVYISTGSGNRIWNSTFINNNGVGVQAWDAGTNNWWNSSGSPHGYGNYWDDLTGPDNIPPYGIVDWSYNLTGGAGAKDWYPQTMPPILPIPEFSEMIVPIVGLMLIASMFGRARKRP